MRAIAGKIRKRAGYVLAALAFMLCMLCTEGNTIVSLADMQIRMISNANVRSEASTDSNVVESVTSGDTLSAAGTVTGSDGMDWYQVSVNGTTGYIRSDLAEDISGEVEAEGAEGSGGGMVTTAASGTVISAENANVRSGPSSDDTPITTVKSGTVVAIMGQSTDDEGNIWYQVEVDGSAGYIRADLIDPIEGEGFEPAEGGMPEEGEGYDIPQGGSEEVKQVLSSMVIPEGVDLEDMEGDSEALSQWALDNYFLLRTEDSSDGAETWYLYSTENNQFERVELVRGGAGGSDSSLSSLMEGKGKFIMVGAAVLFLLLIVVCIVLAVKLSQYRDDGTVSVAGRSRAGSRYDEDEEDDDEEEYDDGDDEEDDEEEYDDDDDDEDDDEYEDDEEDDEYEDDDDGEYEDEDDDGYEDDDDDEYEDEEDDRRSVKKRRWSPKNFLSRRDEEDDDEYDDEEYDDDEYDDEEYDDEEDDDYMDDDDFEFEFLNMDDKDEY